MEEQWKAVEGFSGKYEVSSLGNLRSVDRTVVQKSPTGNGVSVRYLKGCQLKLKKTKQGYYEISFCAKKSKKVTKRVHQLVATAFISNPYNKPHINHINGIKTDNRVENLEWVTPKENVQHAIKNNLIGYLFGEDHQNTHLTKEDVEFIRNNYKYRSKEWNTTTLSKKFGISLQTVLNIVNKKVWNGRATTSRKA